MWFFPKSETKINFLLIKETEKEKESFWQKYMILDLIIILALQLIDFKLFWGKLHIQNQIFKTLFYIQESTILYNPISTPATLIKKFPFIFKIFKPILK